MTVPNLRALMEKVYLAETHLRTLDCERLRNELQDGDDSKTDDRTKQRAPA